MKQPNVVFIDCHDLGDWLGCYDRPDVSTPNLDRLASQGACLRNLSRRHLFVFPAALCLYCSQMPHMIGGGDNFPTRMILCVWRVIFRMWAMRRC